MSQLDTFLPTGEDSLAADALRSTVVTLDDFDPFTTDAPPGAEAAPEPASTDALPSPATPADGRLRTDHHDEAFAASEAETSADDDAGSTVLEPNALIDQAISEAIERVSVQAYAAVASDSADPATTQAVVEAVTDAVTEAVVDAFGEPQSVHDLMMLQWLIDLLITFIFANIHEMPVFEVGLTTKTQEAWTEWMTELEAERWKRELEMMRCQQEASGLAFADDPEAALQVHRPC
ncbi:MAG: hypothetical protein AAF772_03585 [Acidobacteriota bacterium]